MNTPSTPERRYILVLSGQICREHSRDLRNFWFGFVNIQRTINVGAAALDIVAHSWNPEHDALVQSVYAPVAMVSERQPNLASEYMPLIEPVDRFEAGLIRAKSTWQRCNPQALLGNARSRSKAVKLIAEAPAKSYAQVIAARWDQGMTGSRTVHRIIHDQALPEEFLYMAYYSEVDEGYADMWFIAPPEVAKYFARYDEFVLECLSAKNGYFEAFTRLGWPLSIPRKQAPGRLAVRAKALLTKFPRPRFIAFSSRFGSLARRKAIGISQRIEKYIQGPEVTGENAIDFEHESHGSVWPAFQALNNHAILKHFVLQSGLRSKVRFLDINDFESRSKARSGTLINPVSFPLVIYSHSSFSDCWDMAIEQARKNMPANCAIIILLSEDSEQTHTNFKNIKNTFDVELVLYQDTQPYTERLKISFESISNKWPIIYFMHEDMPLYAPVDAHYLNALLHYMCNSNELFIKLVDTSMVDEKTDHPEFPGLKSNMGGYSISVQPALIKAKEFGAFLSNFRSSIYDFENTCVRSNFKASAVAGDRQVGKYLLGNACFPHIATAISKGKWCVSEWPEEIRNLAKLYSIDLAKRGTV